MRVWIICSGEAKAELPKRCAIAEYSVLREHALDGGVLGTPRRVAANGRAVYCSPRLSARETAELSVTGAKAEIEPLLDELPFPTDGKGRVRPLWLWRFLLWLRRLLGIGRAEERERADGRGLYPDLPSADDCGAHRRAASARLLRPAHGDRENKALRADAAEPSGRALRRLPAQLPALQPRLQYRPRQGRPAETVTSSAGKRKRI